VAGILVALVTACWPIPARAQNDWQYPDPYFGILEIEKSHDGVKPRRGRADGASTPGSNRSGTQPPAAAATPVTPPAGMVSPLPPTGRQRWRNRWRR